MSEPKAGAVRRAAITCRAFVPCGDVPGDIDNDITLTLPSQRRMILKDSEMEMRERMGLLKTAVDNDAVDNGSPPECAKMLRDLVFRTHLNLLWWALFGDPPARNKA